jgi:hypothetical protein
VNIKIPTSTNDLEIHYLPFGVTTVAVQIENDNAQNKLIIRPTQRSLPPDYIGYAALNDDRKTTTKDLKIIWGGGMTKGFELDLRPKKTTKLYYLVIHDSNKTLTYFFNLEVIEITTKKENVLTSKSIILKPAYNTSESTSRMTIKYDSVYLRRAVLGGKYAPHYQSRWFGKENSKIKECNLPEFVLKYQVESGEYVGSGVHVGIVTQKGVKEIAKIGGDLERSNLHAELFYFTDKYCVLRIWLYWVNDHFSGNRLISGTQYGSRDKTELRAWKKQVIEVPDAERFDIVVNKQTEQVSYVGTDLHWRETWWSVSGEIARLNFAQMELVPVLIKNLPQILSPYLMKRIQNKAEIFDPAKQLMQDLVKEDIPTGNPSLAVKEHGQSINAVGDTLLGHGLHRKHVPYILDFNLMPLYVSEVLTDL